MVWFLATWPPVVFLLVIAGASAVAVRRGAGSSDAVGDYVTERVSVLLALTLAVVGLSVLFVANGVALTDDWARNAAVGVLIGVAMAAAYFGGLDRAVRWAQAHVCDYVPAGSTAALGAGGAAFFVANVVLAPLVEELWYRGALYDALAPGLSPAVAAIVGCAAFGAFHWPGGGWYVVVTGVLVGGSCWALRAWGGDLAGPYAAHLTLNAIEFAVLTRTARSVPPTASG